MMNKTSFRDVELQLTVWADKKGLSKASPSAKKVLDQAQLLWEDALKHSYEENKGACKASMGRVMVALAVLSLQLDVDLVEAFAQATEETV